MLKCIVFGKGYWFQISKKYITELGFEIIGIVDSRTPKEKVKEYIKKVDYAFVFTPVETHYKICKMLLLNNVNVFCEKPLTKSLEETKELIVLSKKMKLILFTDYTFIYSKGISILKKNLTKIGKIKEININFSQYGKFYKDSNAIETLGVHPLAILEILFPEYDMVIDYCRNLFKGNVYHILGSVNDIQLNFNVSLLSTEKIRHIEVIGTKGIASYDMCQEVSTKLIFYNFSNNNEKIQLNEFNNLNNTMKSFISNNEDIYTRNLKITQKVSEKLDKILDF